MLSFPLWFLKFRMRKKNPFWFKQLSSILQLCVGTTTPQCLDMGPWCLGKVMWDPLPLCEDSLSLSAEALSNTVLWIVLSSLLSSGKVNRIFSFILVVFVLASWTLALHIPFPTINTASAPLPLLCSPFAFSSWTAGVSLVPSCLNSLYQLPC